MTARMSTENDWNADDDFFSQLAVGEIPPVPDEIETQVHKKVNAVLLATHVFEFAFFAIPLACYAFGESVVHFLLLSLTGQMNNDKDIEREQL